MAAVEAKVKASGLGALAAGVIDWALATYVFKGHHVDAAVTAEVYAAVPAVLAFVAGWLAPHTARPHYVPQPAPAPSPPSTVASSGTVRPMPPEPTNVSVQPPAGSL